MNRALAVAAVLSASSALAADLRLYPSFAEIRQPVQSRGTTLNVTLPQEAWANVLPGSLDLEGLNFTQAVQKLEANWLAGLEGKPVTLRRGEATERVTLVRARDLLVKDAQGRYFNARYEDLLFDVQPPLNPQSPQQTLSFTLPAAGSGTLSYLTRGLSWSPRYTLKAGAGGAQLAALADIRNGTELSYDVKNTELYAGEVEVQANPQFAEAANADFAVRAAPTAAGLAAPKIVSQGGLAGLYRYALSTPFTIAPNSVTTLPFLTPKLSTFERYVGLNTYFSTEPQDGTLSRFYRFKADDRLPAGPLTVREEGRIVGQTQIGETRKGGTVEFSLGNDPDVEYARTVQTVSQQKNDKGSVVRTTYKVTYAFESSKDRTVRAEVTERVGGRVIIIDSSAPVRNQGVAGLKVDVPANGKASKSFTVIIDNS